MKRKVRDNVLLRLREVGQTEPAPISQFMFGLKMRVSVKLEGKKYA